MPPDKKGSKGMNWEGAFHYIRPPDEYVEGIDLEAMTNAKG
jgi:hypothetical protein